MKENLLIDKSIAFASRIIKLHQYLISKGMIYLLRDMIYTFGVILRVAILSAGNTKSKPFGLDFSLINYSATVIAVIWGFIPSYQ